MSNLRALREYLASSGSDSVVLSFDEMEAITGQLLPASARRHPAFWSNSEQNAYSKYWRVAGYRATRAGVAPGKVAFTRTTSEGTPLGNAPMNDPGNTSSSGEPDAILVGCVATKASIAMPARELYRSALFVGRKRHAEASGKHWFILSAKYGLVPPDQVIAPYDQRINDLSGSERAEWGQGVASALAMQLGPLQGKIFEVHAGDEYVNAVRGPLRAAGASLYRPLQGLRLGEQLAWYGAPTRQSSPPMPAVRSAQVPRSEVRPGNLGLGRRISEAFVNGTLDLHRPGAPPAGWTGMPEVVAVKRIRAAGASSSAIRFFLTFISAMDRARDADRLWAAGAELYKEASWTFDPVQVVSRRLGELSDLLATHRVSQRHGPDAAGWRRIAESLADGEVPAVNRAIVEGVGDAHELLSTLQRRSPSGPLCPFLAGPKVGPMWIRILAHPGGADIANLGVIPVAVDVQVRKVSEYLGMTPTSGRPLESVREEIQRAWRIDIQQHGAAGPSTLVNTCAALDPALWFFGKWGCTWCEQERAKRPISVVCETCSLGDPARSVQAT